jgi:hypothetical protein
VLSSTILKNGDLVTSGADKSIRFWSLSWFILFIKCFYQSIFIFLYFCVLPFIAFWENIIIEDINIILWNYASSCIGVRLDGFLPHEPMKITYNNQNNIHMKIKTNKNKNSFLNNPTYLQTQTELSSKLLENFIKSLQ